MDSVRDEQGGWEVTPPYTWAVCSKWVMQMSDTHQYGVQTRLFGELSSNLRCIFCINDLFAFYQKVRGPHQTFPGWRSDEWPSGLLYGTHQHLIVFGGCCCVGSAASVVHLPPQNGDVS